MADTDTTRADAAAEGNRPSDRLMQAETLRGRLATWTMPPPEEWTRGYEAGHRDGFVDGCAWQAARAAAPAPPAADGMAELAALREVEEAAGRIAGFAPWDDSTETWWELQGALLDALNAVQNARATDAGGG